MAVEQSIWKIDGKKAVPVRETNLGKEELLEDLIHNDVTILSEDWLLIGRQVITGFGKRIDLLGVDRNGNLVIIELKRDKTEREVVAQALDYASWVRSLPAERIGQISQEFSERYGITGTLSERFQHKFGFALDEEDLNQGHQMVIVASELDPSTERIVNYLSDMQVPINALFFRVFADGDQRYLSRVWLIEPQETEENTAAGSRKVEWNGEYYASFGEDEDRRWDDARKFGFLAAGGGLWYSRTLSLLAPGCRVWVNVPGRGYVGCAEVVGAKQAAEEAELQIEGTSKSLSNLMLTGHYVHPGSKGDDREFIVPVRWIYSVPLAQAHSEVGFFGNQNSVCKPRDAKWNFTVDRLKKVWGIEE